MKPLFMVFATTAWLLQAQTAIARPEYAVKHGYESCTACHVSPTGGGPRNVNGKLYGARGLRPGWNSLNDLASGDFRALLFVPSRASQNRGGLGLMSVIPSVNIPVTRPEGGGWETRGVAAYNLGIFGPGLREAYGIVRPQPDEDVAIVESVAFGRFNAPFGLLTDEHRTYTRLQSRTTLNDYEMGALVSGDPVSQVHYDVALTSGFQSGGNFANADLPFAVTSNFRWNPFDLPFLIGASAAYHRSVVLASPYAAAVYTAISMDRLSASWVNGSIVAEASLAKGWNDPDRNPGMLNFLPSTQTALIEATRTSQSAAWYVQANYDLTERWVLQYKFDQFILDRRFLADAFNRHGFGFRFHVTGNLNVIARYEVAQAGRPELTPGNTATARNDFFTLLHLWL